MTRAEKCPKSNNNPAACGARLVRLGEHPSIGGSGDVGRLVGGLKALMTGGMVAVSACCPRRPRRTAGTRWRREQPDGDLGFQGPGLTKPVASVGFE